MFNRPSDMRYIPFLKTVHRNITFAWYMEIGCRTGRGFEIVRSKTIAVDPFFQISRNVVNEKPALFMLQQTSDAFFESKFLSAINATLSFSFLDGMHLMEFLLRDFINTEKNSSPGGVIALHDCCPYNHEMTTRNVENAPKEAWTGDVWKLIPILQKYRPDLKLTILGCKPTGLVMVHNLSPKSKKLSSNYDKIIEEWVDVTLGEYGVEKFYSSFEYTSCQEVIDSGFKIFEKVKLSDGAIKKPNFISP